MALGSSGGRSANNRNNAPRRATQRERDGIDPPGHSDWEHVRIEEESRPDYRLGDDPKREVILTLVAAGALVTACCFLAILLAAWFGLV